MYNKNEFNKVNDKKVLHKVKKQWVTISLSMFAMLGAAGVAVSSSPIHVNADNTNIEQSNKDNSVNKQVTEQPNKDNSVNKQVTEESNKDNSVNKQVTEESNKDNSVNKQVTEESNKDNSVNKQVTGQLNKDNSKLDKLQELKQKIMNSSSLRMNLPKQQNTSNSSNLSNEDQSHIKSGSIAAWNSIHPDASQSDDNQSTKLDFNNVYYNDAYKGVIDAWNTYQNNNNTNGTQTIKNYSDNTYKMSDSSNPNDPHSVDSNLNNGSYSVNSDNKATIPVDPNNENKSKESKNVITSDNSDNTLVHNFTPDSIVNNYINVVDDDNQRKAYNDGITYFLKNQGTYDAETGRWNGKGKNDAYSPKLSDGTISSNSYDQAYAGAQAAISQQFNSDNTLSYENSTNNQFSQFNPTPQSSDTSYMSGFNDVVSKVNSGISFVSNAAQVNNSLLTTIVPSSDGNQLVAKGTYNYNGHVKSVRFLNDIDYTHTNLGSVPASDAQTNTGAGIEGLIYISNTGIAHTNITFDGQNHISDFDNICYSLKNDSGASDTNLNVQNFYTLYNRDFYGPLKLESTGSINYSNLTYIGPQLTNATQGHVNVYNNLNIFSVGNYKSPFKQNITDGTSVNGNVNGPIRNGIIDTEASNTDPITDGSSITQNSQENFEVGNFELHSGSNYYGSTTGGTVVNVSAGNFVLDSGSHVKLVAMQSNIGKASGGLLMVYI